MALNELIFNRVLKRKIYEFSTSGSVNGLSNEEIKSLALRLKRNSFSQSKIREIGEEAERYFVNVLSQISQEDCNLYIALKSGDVPDKEKEECWNRILSKVDEKAIKDQYIRDKISISPGEDSFFSKAIESIVRRKMQERERTLAKKIDEESANFLMDLESRANQIVYPAEFNADILTALRDGKEIDFLYYVCLRYNHSKGNFGIAADIEPFSFLDFDGQSQKRDGSSKKFQLDTVRELKKQSRNLPHIRHKVIVTDLELKKFLVSDSEHESEAERYVQSVQRYCEEEVQVIGSREYFRGLGFNNREYFSILGLILSGECEERILLEFEKDLESNYRKVSRTLKWDNDQNRFYTASSIALNILEGNILSEQNIPKIVCVFNKDAVVGEQFNISSSRRVPFVALPIHGDNIGGVIYA